MPAIDAVRTYLEMTDPVRESLSFPDDSCRVERVRTCPAAFYRFLYAEGRRRFPDSLALARATCSTATGHPPASPN